MMRTTLPIYAIVVFVIAAGLWSPKSFAEDYLIGNGHHRAIAVIILLSRGELSPDTVVGRVGEKTVTAQQLRHWYENGRLFAYNDAHDPPTVNEILKRFDIKRFTEARGSNPAGGVILRPLRSGENGFKELSKIPKGGIYPFQKPNVQDLINEKCKVSLRAVGG